MTTRAADLEFQYQNDYYRVVRYDGQCSITLFKITCPGGFTLREIFDERYENSEDCLNDWNKLIYFIRSRKEIRVCA